MPSSLALQLLSACQPFPALVRLSQPIVDMLCTDEEAGEGMLDATLRCASGAACTAYSGAPPERVSSDGNQARLGHEFGLDSRELAVFQRLLTDATARATASDAVDESACAQTLATFFRSCVAPVALQGVGAASEAAG